ncbi:MAG: ubiquinol oxidase subunit II [Acetobacteraceae bacterium]|nr:ubiquinol oxidase subunit II [Acetobacteraceae bacterium]
MRDAREKPARRGRSSAPRSAGQCVRLGLRAFAWLLVPGLLGGCSAVVLGPSGYIALRERNLIIAVTLLMLLIIVPVMVLTAMFARRYRAGNPEAVYDPEWHHSTQLEVVIWSVPLLIIICIGAITWLSTHTLDPYRPLSRVDPSQPVPAGVKPLTIEVVSLDWKWLFLYPDHGVATVNEIRAPVNVPIFFKITSGAVMNSFFIPALAGQIYAMGGMQTQLHAVINQSGEYEGFSGNYSGVGFSRMNFRFYGTSQQDFDQWLAKVKSGGAKLDRAAYLQLEKPSEDVPVQYFSGVEDGLWDRILNLCVDPGSMCLSEMRQIDLHGGGGAESEQNAERLQYDNRRLEEKEGPEKRPQLFFKFGNGEQQH